MKYTIGFDHDKVTIDVGDVAGNQDAALASFRACAQGHCACPTREYAKLAGIEVAAQGDRIAVRLTPKPGESIDPAEIAKCLDHTAKAIG